MYQTNIPKTIEEMNHFLLWWWCWQGYKNTLTKSGVDAEGRRGRFSSLLLWREVKMNTMISLESKICTVVSLISIEIFFLFDHWQNKPSVHELLNVHVILLILASFIWLNMCMFCVFHVRVSFQWESQLFSWCECSQHQSEGEKSILMRLWSEKNWTSRLLSLCSTVSRV